MTHARGIATTRNSEKEVRRGGRRWRGGEEEEERGGEGRRRREDGGRKGGDVFWMKELMQHDVIGLTRLEMIFLLLLLLLLLRERREIPEKRYLKMDLKGDLALGHRHSFMHNYISGANKVLLELLAILA